MSSCRYLYADYLFLYVVLDIIGLILETNRIVGLVSVIVGLLQVPRNIAE